ncbi:15361_t:CDS:10 [Entrophospora sp. SA101]|nr:15356_t:CDS:10 [Entrophospora sp. SA101]CAJ0909383.1 15361_t:CDS:10 [Entrophospora sp. SA101]
MSSAYPALNDLFEFLNSFITNVSILYSKIPGSGILLKYIKNSHQDDPYRTTLELFLEVEELVDEWQPEPLVSKLSDDDLKELEKVPIINGPQGSKVKLTNGKTLMNFASFDFLGMLSRDEIKEKAIATLRKYGVGSCGPPGFYGTFDVHTEFEKKVSEFLGTEDTILYSQGFSTIGSAIPSFCKRGDIIVADQGCNFAIQKGIQISRSVIKWYKHNDMEDLERILQKIKDEDIEIELKKKFKYRLILDESLSFGTMGKRGAGLTDYFNIPVMDVDMIVGSMCTALCSSGGFCSGSFEVTEHQKISGPAYCYSASLPAMLAVSATESLSILSKNSQLLITTLSSNIQTFRNCLSNVKYINIEGSKDSPVLHLRINEDVIKIGNVNEAMNNGVLLTRSKYVKNQELFNVEPSIRICISTIFTKKEIEKSANIIKLAINKILKNKIK